MSRVIVIIPTYNEVENIPLIVSEVLAQDDRIEILVVDDNSPDGTGKVADDLREQTGRVHVLHRPEKAGLGAAYRAGLAEESIRICLSLRQGYPDLTALHEVMQALAVRKGLKITILPPPVVVK